MVNISEEKKPEKWEKANWHLFPYSAKTWGRGGSLVCDKIILTDDELSIGNFSFKLANIVRFQHEKANCIAMLLSDRLGFEFDNFDLQKNVREIHELLLKKEQS